MPPTRPQRAHRQATFLDKFGVITLIVVILALSFFAINALDSSTLMLLFNPVTWIGAAAIRMGWNLMCTQDFDAFNVEIRPGPKWARAAAIYFGTWLIFFGGIMFGASCLSLFPHQGIRWCIALILVLLALFVGALVFARPK